MKRFFGALLGASLLAISAPTSTAAVTPQADVATRALNWVQQTQLGADGSVGADPTRTEEVVWGLVANHHPIAGFVKAGSTNTPLDYLRANVAKEEATAGNIAQLILAVTAAGQDPKSFGPEDARHNLVSDLSADYKSATGQFGADIFGHVLSVLAIRSANETPPVAALAFLKSQQKQDGSWSSDNADAFGTDSNTTALALLAFASTSSVDGCVAKNALSFLKGLQQSSGGFAFQAGSPSDPDSDGFVIEGLLAVGQDPTSAAWTMFGDKNAVTDLISFQGTDGGFSYPGIGSDNLLATTQPLVALASTHLPLSPLGTSFATPSVPACQQAVATASPTPPTVPVLARTGSPTAPPETASVMSRAALLLLGVMAILLGWSLRRRLR